MSSYFKICIYSLLIVAPVFASPHKNHGHKSIIPVATVTKKLEKLKISEASFKILMAKFDALEKAEELWLKKQDQKALKAAKIENNKILS